MLALVEPLAHRYRGNVVVQEQAAKMLRILAEAGERNKAVVRELVKLRYTSTNAHIVLGMT